MRSSLALLVAFSAITLFAAEAPPPRSPRPIFPDDYKKHPCAPDSCESFEPGMFRSAAFRFLGLSSDPKWWGDHEDELRAVVAPYCQKRNSCIATPGNTHMFCDDLLAQPIRDICDERYPRSKSEYDWSQCRAWMETWELGWTQRSLEPWREAQACANEKTPGKMHASVPDIWIAPEKIPFGYTGYMTVYALDQETHIPVYAHISFEGQEQKIYAPANPTGETATAYPFKANFKLIRVPNAEGHTDLIAPMVTVSADYYPTSTFRLPMVLPKMIIEMNPSLKELRNGGNTVTFFAHDSESGKPVEARVMLGERILGDTNVPLTIEKKRKEKLPEIWATSLYDRYGDVVVVPAEK